MTTIERALAVARELTPEEQVTLANILLEDAAEPTPEGWWESIEPEIERRIRAIESGEERTYSLEEVRKRVQERLDGARTSIL